MSSTSSLCDKVSGGAARSPGGPLVFGWLAEAMANAGAAAWGIAEAGEVDSAEMERFDRFIAEGRHASMEYLERYREIRRDPLRLLEGEPTAGTVVVGAFPYASEYHPAPGADRIARYALGDDYHEVLRKRLKPVAAMIRENGFQARVCVDSAPILERYWAERAGLGHRGLNRQISIPGLGSYFFLAEIVTDAPVGFFPAPKTAEGNNPERTSPPKTTSCTGCGACAAACPTGALRPDGSFDARLCINYLTIEHRGPLPASIPPETLRGVLYGCDRCQEICPLNSSITAAPLPEFTPRPALLELTRETLDSLQPEERAELLRRSPLRRGLNRR